MKPPLCVIEHLIPSLLGTQHIFYYRYFDIFCLFTLCCSFGHLFTFLLCNLLYTPEVEQGKVIIILNSSNTPIKAGCDFVMVILSLDGRRQLPYYFKCLYNDLSEQGVWNWFLQWNYAIKPVRQRPDISTKLLRQWHLIMPSFCTDNAYTPKLVLCIIRTWDWIQQLWI